MRKENVGSSDGDEWTPQKLMYGDVSSFGIHVSYAPSVVASARAAPGPSTVKRRDDDYNLISFG